MGYIVYCQCGYKRHYYGHGNDTSLYSCNECSGKPQGFKAQEVDRWNRPVIKKKEKDTRYVLGA